MEPANRPILAAVTATASALMFAVTGATVKAVSGHLPYLEMVFFRSALGLVFLLPWLLHQGLANLRTERPGLHLVRGLTGLGTIFGFFYALSHLELATAVLFNNTAPLFIPLFAVVLLGERSPASVWVAIPVGFVGVALILKPGMAPVNPAALAGLGGAVLAAASYVVIRRLRRTEPTSRVVFYFAAIATLLSALPLPWVWETPEPRLWILLLTMGAAATGGQLFLTQAYALAPAARVGPFTYLVVVFSAALGWVLWGEWLDPLSLLGAVLICGAGILAIQGRGAARTALPPAGPPAPRG